MSIPVTAPFANLVRSPVEELIETSNPLDSSLKTVYPELSGKYKNILSCTTFKPPEATSSNLLNLTDDSGRGFLDFYISKDVDTNKVEIIKFNFTLRNTTVTPCYVAPTPCWFSRVDVNEDGSNVSLNPTDFISHMAYLMTLDRDMAVKILADEGFQALQSETNISFTGGASPVISFNPVLYPSVVVAPGTSVTLSYYLFNSIFTAPGFSPLFLQNKMLIRLNFLGGARWLSVANGVTMTECRMQTTGQKYGPSEIERIKRSIDFSSPISIPITRHVFKIHSELIGLVAGVSNDITFNELIGNYTAHFFFLNDSQPATSNFPSSQQGSAQWFQNISPGTLSFDLVGNTSVAVQPTYGESYAMNQVTYYPSGSANGIITSNSTGNEINTFTLEKMNYNSYLLSNFKSYYFIPFTSHLREDIFYQRANTGGVINLNGSSRITFTTSVSLPSACLWSVGFKCCQVLVQNGTLNPIGL